MATDIEREYAKAIKPILSDQTSEAIAMAVKLRTELIQADTKLNKRLEPLLMKPLITPAEAMGIVNWMEPLTQISQEHDRILNQITTAMKPFVEFNERFRNFLKENSETLEKLRMDKDYLEYPFLMGGIERFGEMKELAKKWIDGDKNYVKEYMHKKTIDEGFSVEYTKQLARRPYFSKAKPIIEHIFEAHRAGRYSLTIPTLFLLIDGALISTFDKDFEYISLKKERCPTCNSQTQPNANNISKGLQDRTEYQSSLFDSFGVLAYLKKNYHERRSQILHGKQLEYYMDRDLSTILILALDSTGEVIERYQKTKGALKQKEEPANPVK